MTWKKDIGQIIRIQEEGVEAFKKSNGTILYEYATGVGKSRQALMCMQESIEAGERWTLLCWEIAHIQNWKNEFEAWGLSSWLKNIDILCYASFANYCEARPGENFNLVCDEAHHMFSPSVYGLASTRHKKLIMLTATMPMTSKAIMKSQMAYVKTKRVTLSQAIELNILPEPSIWKVPVIFNNNSPSEIIHITRGARVKWEKMPSVECTFKDFKKHLIGNPPAVNITVRCTPGEKLKYLDDNVEFRKNVYISNKTDFNKNLWMQSGLARKRFLADIKTKYGAKLIPTLLKTRKSIVFCGTVDQVIALGGKDGIHSKKTAKQNREIIQKFQDGDIDILYTNKMIREGINIADIECAMIIQLDNQSLSFIQMAGRAMRAQAPELYVLTVPNSRDEELFATATAGISAEYIKDLYSQFLV